MRKGHKITDLEEDAWPQQGLPEADDIKVCNGWKVRVDWLPHFAHSRRDQ